MTDHSHISSAEIEQDVADTEREIAVMGKEITAFELIPHESVYFRMANFRASARRDGIKERLAFIAKLRAILESRTVNKLASP